MITKKRSAFIVLIIMLAVLFLTRAFGFSNNLNEAIFSSVDQIGIEVMSIPAHVTITESKEIDTIVALLSIDDWKKINQFDYEYSPSDYILAAGEYVLWIGEWNDEFDVCFVTRRNSPSRLFPYGKYRIPKTVIPNLDEYTKDLF